MSNYFLHPVQARECKDRFGLFTEEQILKAEASESGYIGCDYGQNHYFLIKKIPLDNNTQETNDESIDIASTMGDARRDRRQED